MSPASVGAYIAAAPTAFQKRAPFADPATAPARLTVNAVRVSFVYARFAYGRNRLLRVASALASREARVSRCADRPEATRVFGGKSEQNFHKKIHASTNDSHRATVIIAVIVREN